MNLVASWGLSASDWEDFGKELEPFRRNWLWRGYADAVNRKALAPWVDGGWKRVLKTDAFDEAVGEGVMDLFGSRAENVVLMDISTSLLASLRRRTPRIQAAAADVRRLPFGAAAFDGIISFRRLTILKTATKSARRCVRSTACSDLAGICGSPWTTLPTRQCGCGISFRPVFAGRPG